MYNFKKQVWIFLILVFLSISVLLVVKNLGGGDAQPGNQVTIDGTVINVSLATTPAEQEQGLSGTQLLGADEGMLFVFDTPGLYPFWMKDMLYPLDIVWISGSGSITDIEKNLQPSTYPKSFAPSLPSLYVLEVGAGTADKDGWKVGDKVSF